MKKTKHRLRLQLMPENALHKAPIIVITATKRHKSIFESAVILTL